MRIRLSCDLPPISTHIELEPSTPVSLLVSTCRNHLNVHLNDESIDFGLHSIRIVRFLSAHVHVIDASSEQSGIDAGITADCTLAFCAPSSLFQRLSDMKKSKRLFVAPPSSSSVSTESTTEIGAARDSYNDSDCEDETKFSAATFWTDALETKGTMQRKMLEFADFNIAKIIRGDGFLKAPQYLICEIFNRETLGVVEVGVVCGWRQSHMKPLSC